ncbi:hypothetical protein RASY3_10050 [Ruminococcus albus SY3]|uniref:ESAT-6-like protein n=1 Tax=Ruminococcus albus SY3 TaxID=1341156 RepID=A0A011WSN6_RUMAL|nr:hypothetical protein [Ruminococcus albus]EXM40000.1 hypothetical protein RASY3_10050 [Ruminococcus albus SY3]
MADEFVVNDAVFKVVDTTEISKLQTKAQQLVQDFEDLKTEFNRINGALLDTWEGEGADEYKYETDHILEKIGDMNSAVDALNTDGISNVRQSISDMDAELGEQIRKMANDEEE